MIHFPLMELNICLNFQHLKVYHKTMSFGAKKKKKYGTGVVGQLAKRRAERQSEGKWTLGEKLTKAGRKRATARKETRATTRKGKKAIKAGERIKAGKAIGMIYTDDYEHKTVLKFQVWKNTSKQNPSRWLKK